MQELKSSRRRLASILQDRASNVCLSHSVLGKPSPIIANAELRSRTVNRDAHAQGEAPIHEAGVHWTACRFCQAYPIRGTMYSCTTCQNFDTCEPCNKQRVANQGHQHQFDAYYMPKAVGPPLPPGTVIYHLHHQQQQQQQRSPSEPTSQQQESWSQQQYQQQSSQPPWSQQQYHSESQGQQEWHSPWSQRQYRSESQGQQEWHLPRSQQEYRSESQGEQERHQSPKSEAAWPTQKYVE
jgi:hypothetical protein